jgi:hypothetical protein
MRELAHRGQTIAWANAFALDRFDELVGKLNVKRTRVARLKP